MNMERDVKKEKRYRKETGFSEIINIKKHKKTHRNLIYNCDTYDNKM